MQEIIYQQRNAARPLTGKSFILSIAGIIVRLAIAQYVINLLISLTGAGLLNVAFYLYAVWLLIMFMRGTVASYVYTLKADTLVLERRLGDSTITVIEIPLDSVVSLRKMHMGENLAISYRDVMHIDPQSRPSARVRAGFALSLISGKLARLAAGRRVEDVIGYTIVYDAGNVRCARTFCPNAQLLEMLAEKLGDSFSFDERMTHGRLTTLYARALERAFPALYPFVEPLISHADVEWANEEVERQKQQRRLKREARGKTPSEKQETTGGDGAEQPRRRRKQG